MFERRLKIFLLIVFLLGFDCLGLGPHPIRRLPERVCRVPEVSLELLDEPEPVERFDDDRRLRVDPGR